MILIIAKATVKKDKLDEFKGVAARLIKNTRSEDGCIEYALYENNENPNILTFVEKWRDQEAVDKHGSTDFFKENIKKIISYSENLDISLNTEV